MKQIKIESLDEGYLITDVDSTKTYAASTNDRLVTIIKRILGITDKTYVPKEKAKPQSQVQAQTGKRKYIKSGKYIKGDENGSCDDVTFESCKNNNPETCKVCLDQSQYAENS